MLRRLAVERFLADPALLFEQLKLIKSNPAAEEWARGVSREAASAALAEAGYVEDPNSIFLSLDLSAPQPRTASLPS